MHCFTNTYNVYFRFNVEQGMQSVSLFNWEKLANVEAHTSNYLGLEQVMGNLTAAVDALHAGAKMVPTSQLSMLLLNLFTGDKDILSFVAGVVPLDPPRSVLSKMAQA